MIEETDDIPASPEQDEPREPRSSKPYLDAILVAQKAFEDYHTRCDKIDKLYASLSAKANVDRDREFAMFWANVQVLAPSIYSRPPVPVATVRWKDRDPVVRAGAELLERDLLVTFEKEDIDGVMRLIRDDLAILARGVPWLIYEKRRGEEHVLIEHVSRRDYLHNLARKWKEVQRDGWVAKRSWLDKKAMRKRFKKHSGNAYLEAEYSVRKEDREKGGADNKAKAGVWEIWHEGENKVIWVTPGVDVVLDSGDPHLNLEGFYPSPKPAYGTVERDTLIPVPDFVMYKDQLEEINELTARIGALQQALKVRGFYPAGAGEIGDAIQTAVLSLNDNAIMVPISNWAMMGNGAAKDTIVWMPIEQISKVITDCVNLRRQYIDDVYQITGLSDIMRGSTDPNETLGAQQLKSQYGSIRVRDRQNELVRVARDIAVIAAEIMAENFSSKTLVEMSQLKLRTDKEVKADISKVVQQAEQQAVQIEQQPTQDPQADQQKQQQLSQIQSQAQEQIGKLAQEPTVEKVVKLLRDERIRPFMLDIETDSTIQPDEDAEKQRRSEMTQALGGLLGQIAPLIQTAPELAQFGGEFMKFAMGAFRSNRELDTAVDELIENMKAKAGQPQPNPEAEKTKAEMEMRDKEIQSKERIEQAKLGKDQETAQQEQQFKLQEMQAEAQRDERKAEQEMRKGELEMQKIQAEIQLLREKAQLQAQTEQIKLQATERKAQIDEQSMVQQASIQAQSAQQDAAIKASTAEQQAEIQSKQAEQSAQHNEQAFQQKSSLAEQQAAMRPQGGA